MAKSKSDQTLPVNVDMDQEPSSSITYANEVIAIIAGLAASEVEGVAGMVTPFCFFIVQSLNMMPDRNVKDSKNCNWHED